MGRAQNVERVIGCHNYTNCNLGIRELGPSHGVASVTRISEARNTRPAMFAIWPKASVRCIAVIRPESGVKPTCRYRSDDALDPSLQIRCYFAVPYRGSPGMLG
jgi:hypothetical protein